MTRSVEELRRESERSRAELTAAADRLRERLSETAEDTATRFRRSISKRKSRATSATRPRVGPTR
jgi:hypothetical protein